jgi:hypothetical protein
MTSHPQTTDNRRPSLDRDTLRTSSALGEVGSRWLVVLGFTATTTRRNEMKYRELKQAVRLLKDRIDRYETMGTDTGGWVLTAHWLDGGQTLFRTLEHVQSHVETHTSEQD